MGESPPSAVERLRARLRELGWSQTDLAATIGASTAVVSRWLSGDRTPSLEMAFRIQNSEVALPADIWIDSGEHPAAEPAPRNGTDDS